MPLLPPPIIHLPSFEGPLDLLLHLIREQKMEIGDIPIAAITDQYMAIISDAQERKLQLAGEFFVMAATLLEIKTRLMLPKPPQVQGDEEAEADGDPRDALAERLLEYERFKALVPMLQDWEQERARCFLRSVEDVESLYDAPAPKFGQASPQSLLRALKRILELAAEIEPEVTSVHRRKLSLHLAMRLMLAHVADAGPDGLEFFDLFQPPLALFDVIMTFLALLELLRQGRLDARQTTPLAPIHVRLAATKQQAGSADVVQYAAS